MKNMSAPEDSDFNGASLSTVHFIETSPSILREMPFVICHEYKVIHVPVIQMMLYKLVHII